MPLSDLGLDTVTLASLAPGDIAQVVQLQPGIDPDVVQSLRSRGLLTGTRLRVQSVEGGEFTVQAARGLVAVSTETARSILVVPGDLAAISDRIARDDH